MAVPWKNDEAPTVMPWTRVVIVMSPLGLRVPNYPHHHHHHPYKYQGCAAGERKERDMRTREKPGDGIASVPRIKESFSA